MGEDTRSRGPGLAKFGFLLVLISGIYVISSGPVLATAFWLREATGWNGFYSALWIYWPLLITSVGKEYVDWWVRLLGTVGPG